MTSAAGQVLALLALRWQMMRAPGLRAALVLGTVCFGWLLLSSLEAAAALDAAALATALDLAPTAFLALSVLAIVAPLTAGGGNELVPPDQLTAYPVRPATQYFGGLLLTPLNLVWVVQLLVLAGLTSCLTAGGSVLRGGATTLAYVVSMTVCGHALAWVVVGLRQTRSGRRAVGAAGVAALVVAAVVVRTGRGGDLLDVSPTHQVVAAVIAGGQGFQAAGSASGQAVWATTTAALVVLTALGLLLGARACRWALGRSSDVAAGAAVGPVRRRGTKSGQLRELMAVDRASVWRAPALRRGGLVLALLPGVLAISAAIPWQLMVVLPGLVAAGAGLLFGVNVFCLDGAGSVWLASLPHDPRLVVRAKALVLTETVLAAVVIAAVSGSVRSPGEPTSTQLAAIAASGLTCTAVVVATCLRMSVRRPHRADLHGPRDAVAPPGALAAASVRLAVPAAIVGVLLGSASQIRIWWWPPLLALPVLLMAVLSVMRSLRRYDDPFVRARIVQTVTAG